MTVAAPVARKNLADVNTRLHFYNELLEMWRTGQELVRESNARFPTPKDRTRLTEIAAALKLLEAERDVCAGYDKEQFRLKYEIDSIPRIKSEKTEEAGDGA